MPGAWWASDTLDNGTIQEGNTTKRFLRQLRSGRTNMIGTNKQTCYYAHSKLDYGTKREAEEIAYLSQYYNVLDPNSFIGERGAMFPYLAAVAMCNVVVVSPHDGYYVGKGCFHEVCAALALAIPCRLMDGVPCDIVDMKSVTGVRIYDPNDWKKNYGILLV